MEYNMTNKTSRRAFLAKGLAAGAAAGTAVAGGAGLGASAGAIAGSTAGAVAAGSTGAVAGAATGGAVGSAAGAAGPSIIAGIATGPVGWAVLGAEATPDAYTWDCWKSILHDTSSEPSKGKLFRDVVTDGRVKSVYLSQADGSSHMIVENIWEESYRIDPVVLPWNEVALHATRMM